MISEKEFNKCNFFEQIEKFEEFVSGLNDIPKYLEEAVKFFNSLKTENLRKYKIDPNKSRIFVTKDDFGLKIVHLDYAGREILFNFDKYENSLIFHDGADTCYDNMFGQHTEHTIAYLLKNLENIKKITKQGKYVVEDVIVDSQNNIISKTDHLHILDFFHVKRILGLLAQKSTKIITWK